MSNKITTPHGLKYVLSDEVLERVMEADGDSDSVWNPLNQIVENAELFKPFCAFLAFILLAFFTDFSWYVIIAISLGIQVIASILSNSVGIMRNPVTTIVLNVFSLLTKLFLHYAATIVVSIFVLRRWYAAVIFIVLYHIMQMLLIMLIDGYETRKAFNDRAAIVLIRKHEKQS